MIEVNVKEFETCRPALAHTRNGHWRLILL
jgi:hypothetical protein